MIEAAALGRDYGSLRAVDRGARGELSLIMDGAGGEAVPVSRRNVPAVRRALGL